MIKTSVIICLAFIGATGCSFFNRGNHEEPVARVFEQYLYPSDLDIPEGIPVQDSLILAKRYIETWVKDQLMLHRAEQALTEEQKDFEKQIAEYRRALLIYSYREKLLHQKLDTVVTRLEMQAYYEENTNNFLLSQDVIKGTLIKVPVNSPRMDELRQWSRSNGADDLDQMEKYCISHAGKYNDFNNNWIYLSSIQLQLPMTIFNPSSYLKYNRNIEAADSAFTYLLHVSEHLTEGEVAPLELVAGDISAIILNKRKIEFFRDLEQKVYEDGVARNQFEIYQ
jgi:hypothetical protein